MSKLKRILPFMALVILAIMIIQPPSSIIQASPSQYQQLLLAVKDFNYRMKIIDSIIYSEINNNWGNVSSRTINNIVNKIYKYHKNDVNKILDDLYTTWSILDRINYKDRETLIKTLAENGYSNQDINNIIGIISNNVTINPSTLKKGITLIQSNDKLLKEFIIYIVYEEIKTQLQTITNPEA